MISLSLTIIALPIFANFPPYVQAQNLEQLEEELRKKEEEIRKVEEQLTQARNQAKTLKNQLSILDNQINLTSLKIEQTKYQIAKLEKEIQNLEASIDKISHTIDSLTNLLIKRIVATYKYNRMSTLDLIFSSQSLGDLLRRIKYIQAVQIYDKKKLYELQATKNLFNDQKEDKTSRQEEQQRLQAKLEDYQHQLEEQKKTKEELLRITQNDEKKFQALLERLRADKESIARALGGRGVKLGPVKRGDRIASVGNSGCSTGPHLHLEVMTPAKVEDGRIIGAENKVDPKPYIDSGEFAKPTENYTGHDCSQGGACYAGSITTRFKQWYNVLGGSFHTGLDIADYYGSAIYAVKDGTAYAIQDTKPCSLTGTVGKGVIVDHGNGIVTLYWHIP